MYDFAGKEKQHECCGMCMGHFRLGRKRMMILAVWFVFVVLVTAFVRAFVIDVNVVRGNSMSMTLLDGDMVLGCKFGEISRGDIVTLWYEENEEVIIKRVVGLPGEQVVIDDGGIVYINGVKLEREYQYPTVGLEIPYSQVMLADDEYFVLGDNRYSSYDSRYFGPVEEKDIRDVTIFKLFPFTVY